MSILLPFLVFSSLPSTDSSGAFSAFTSKTPAEITKYGADSVAVTDRYDAEALQSLMNPPVPDNTFCSTPFLCTPSTSRVMFMSPTPCTHRSRSSATVTDQVPSAIGLNVENHSRCSVMCSVAPESANQACLSRFTLNACDRLLITINVQESSDSLSE